MPLGAEQHKSSKRNGFLEICGVFATRGDEVLQPFRPERPEHSPCHCDARKVYLAAGSWLRPPV